MIVWAKVKLEIMNDQRYEEGYIDGMNTEIRLNKKMFSKNWIGYLFYKLALFFSKSRS